MNKLPLNKSCLLIHIYVSLSLSLSLSLCVCVCVCAGVIIKAWAQVFDDLLVQPSPIYFHSK